MLQSRSLQQEPAGSSKTGRSAARMNQLRDKMVLQMVQKLKKRHPQLIVDPSSIELVKHELELMMAQGPVDARDLNRMSLLLKASAEANANTTMAKKANTNRRC